MKRLEVQENNQKQLMDLFKKNENDNAKKISDSSSCKIK
jgi:hypothetical protein